MAAVASKMRFVSRALVVATISLFAWAEVATAQSGRFDFDGDGLLKQCEARQVDAQSYVDSGTCFGFIVGVIAMIAVYQDGNIAPQTICIPEGVRPKQALDIVVQYLHGHANDRHADAAMLVWRAFSEAYPCKK
jgi:hypothetical protein